MTHWVDFWGPLLIMVLPLLVYFLADEAEHRRKEEEDDAD